MPEIVHFELATTDTGAAKDFYASVFGWSYQDVPMPNGMTYTMVSGSDGPFGGMLENPMPASAPAWVGYIGVKSLSATIDKVVKAGGQVVAQQSMPGMGSWAVFVDPQGAVIAAWEPAEQPKEKKKAAKKKAAKKKTAKKKAAKKKTAKKKAAKKKTAKKKAAKKKASKKKASKKKASKKKASKKKAFKKKTAKKKR